MATGGRAIAAVLATGGVARRITVTTTRGARELGLALATARLERRLVAAAKGAETTASVTPATLATCRATGGKIATTLATRSKVATACRKVIWVRRYLNSSCVTAVLTVFH